MKKSFLAVSFLIFGFALVSFAQNAKTVTNADLEKFRERRLQAEADYRANHKKLGMPSPEELEQRAAQDRLRSEEMIRINAENRRQNQAFWNSRSDELKFQIINLNAQINYLSSQIANTPVQNPIFVSPAQLNTVVFGGYYGVRQNYGYGSANSNATSNVQIAVNSNATSNVQTVRNASAGNPNPFFGTPLYAGSIKNVVGPPLQYQRGYRRSYYPAYIPFPVNNSNNYQRDELIGRVRYLEQFRAGLLAQWRSLAEDARRNGVNLVF